MTIELGWVFAALVPMLIGIIVLIFRTGEAVQLLRQLVKTSENHEERIRVLEGRPASDGRRRLSPKQTKEGC